MLNNFINEVDIEIVESCSSLFKLARTMGISAVRGLLGFTIVKIRSRELTLFYKFRWRLSL